MSNNNERSTEYVPSWDTLCNNNLKTAVKRLFRRSPGNVYKSSGNRNVNWVNPSVSPRIFKLIGSERRISTLRFSAVDVKIIKFLNHFSCRPGQRPHLNNIRTPINFRRPHSVPLPTRNVNKFFLLVQQFSN